MVFENSLKQEMIQSVKYYLVKLQEHQDIIEVQKEIANDKWRLITKFIDSLNPSVASIVWIYF